MPGAQGRLWTGCAPDVLEAAPGNRTTVSLTIPRGLVVYVSVPGANDIQWATSRTGLTLVLLACA